MMQLVRMSMVCAAVALAATSCQPVKEYQKSKINDADMTLSARKTSVSSRIFKVIVKVLRAQTAAKRVEAVVAINQ